MYSSKAIVFSDLDDTLLQSNHFFSKVTKQAVKALYEQGIYFIPITARGTRDSISQACRLRLDEYGGIAVANNGSQIYDFKNQKWILNEHVPQKIVWEIFDEHFNKFKCKINFSGDDVTYVFNESRNAMYWAQIMGSDYIVAHEKEEIDKPINHLTMILKKETTPKESEIFLSTLKEQYEGKVNITAYTPRIIEIAPLNVNKGYAIRKIKEYLEVDSAVTTSYAFGDSYNDLSMFEAATIGVAMENGVQAVKSLADDITEFNNNDNGVAEYIMKKIL